MMDDVDIQEVLEQIEKAVRPLTATGRVATYIPALARARADAFGIAVVTAEGVEYVAGDGAEPFSIQSLSKVFALAFALNAEGEALWSRVGRESSGMRFNSMILLELEKGIPRNPLVNAGALVVADALLKLNPDWGEVFPKRLKELAGSDDVQVDEEVFQSERDFGDLNRSIAWFLKANGNLHLPPETVTEAYFRGCAVSASCLSVARAARFLIDEHQDAPICRNPERVRRIQAVMRTCGLYDAAGDFAYHVGLPAKSGVGGGVLAISPGRYAACVWSPPLDEKGNSVAGVRALELLTQALGW